MVLFIAPISYFFSLYKCFGLFFLDFEKTFFIYSLDDSIILIESFLKPDLILGFIEDVNQLFE